MLTDIGISSLLMLLFALGLKRPYMALCAVVVVDLMVPQKVSFAFLQGQPLSQIAFISLAICMLTGYQSVSKPARLMPSFVLALFMGWITFTTFYAEFQGPAWFKYDFVIKTLIVMWLFPFLLNSRLAVESIVLSILAAAAYFLVIGGMRSILGQGQYGQLLVVTGLGSTLIAETSTLSMAGIFVLPFLHYMAKYSLVGQRNPRFMFYFCSGMAFLSVMTLFGTHARTGLVGALVLLSIVFMRAGFVAKIRILFVGTILGTTILLTGIAGEGWFSRMNTVSDVESEGSALGRIIVWKWTLDYVSENPMGGGFDAYRANAGQLYEYNHTDTAISYHSASGKAFHSIYFEVLGEHGYVGLCLYLYMMYLVWRLCRQIERRYSGAWAVHLAIAIRYALLVYMACGSFIGIAYMQWLFYLLGMAGGLHNAMALTSSKPKILQNRLKEA